MAKSRKTPGKNARKGNTLNFADAAGWERWLKKNFDKSSGVWLRLGKKGSGVKSVSLSEALDVALCYGWITGQAKGETSTTWLAQFAPRSGNSIWSKINREKANELVRNGRMKPPGLTAIERAKQNGRWHAAYDSPRSARVPEDLQIALDANPRAREFFSSLDSQNRYAILFRIQTIKRAETRSRKISDFVAMLKRRQTIHPARAGRRLHRGARRIG